MKTLLAVLALTGTMSWTDAALILSGAASLEELSSSELEQYSSYHDHPLHINSVGRSRIMSSGLFTNYQVASLMDYRKNSGDILSVHELSLIDGFNMETAEALSNFISFCGEMNGRTYRRLEAEGYLKYSAPENLGVKSRFTWDDRFEVNAGNKSWSAAYYGSKLIGKIALGDMNVRFGQGLLIWNGFSISGFGSISAFRKNAGGISTCLSYSDQGHIRGVGADFVIGKWTLAAVSSLSSSIPGKYIPQTAAVNLSRCGKSSTLGATCMLDGSNLNASIDYKFGFAGLSIFGEAGYVDGMPQAIAGIIWTPKYKLEFALRGEWSGNLDAAAGARWNWCFASLEYNVRNIRAAGLQPTPTAKSKLKLTPEFHPGGLVVKPSLQWQERYRPLDANALRSEVRTEVELDLKSWVLHGRLDYVHCVNSAMAAYLEGGYKGETLSCYLRAGAFRVDNWQDRIYIYERDVPGSYNVPARYGRGGWCALCSGIRFRALKALHSIGLRLAGTWFTADSGKEPRAEVKLQYTLRL